MLGQMRLLLVPAVEHHEILFGRVPRIVATDRGSILAAASSAFAKWVFGPRPS